MLVEIVNTNPGAGTAAGTTDDLESNAAAAVAETVFEPGRPNIKAIVLPDVSLDETHRDLACYTCGPPALISSVAALCKERSIVCHAETFLF